MLLLGTLRVRTGRKLAEMRQNLHHHTVVDREEELAAAAVAAYGKSKKCGISTSSRTNHKFSAAMHFPARSDLREMMMMVCDDIQEATGT